MSKYKTSAGLVAGLLMAVGGIASAQEGQPPEPTMDKVSDSVYHYFSFGYSSMVVVGEDAVLVTDPSFDPRGSMLRAAIEEITAAPIKYVVLSHEHYDHAGGTDSFTDAQVICHEACHEVMDMSPLLPVADIDMTYDDSLTLDLGGVSVDLVHIAPGDGIATTVAHVPSDGVVFSADMYEPRSFTAPEFVEDKNYVGTRIDFPRNAELESDLCNQRSFSRKQSGRLEGKPRAVRPALRRRPCGIAVSDEGGTQSAAGWRCSTCPIE